MLDTYVSLQAIACQPDADLISSAYVLFPPTVPARDYLLSREPITGVARPADQWKNSSPYKKSHAWGLMTSLLTTGYISALFVLTFTGTLDL